MHAFIVDLTNKPGELARVTEAIAEKGINIEAAMPTGMAADKVMVSFATDNPTKAREILGASAPTGIGVG